MTQASLKSLAMKLFNVLTTTAAAVVVISLTGCMNSDTKLLWGVNEGANKPQKKVKVASRPPLEVPPGLQGKIEVPHADQIGVQQAMPSHIAKSVGNIDGKQVALDARVYKQPIATVFSSVVDAMTALNLPVQSVDSASGTITTDWVRKSTNKGAIGSLLGGGGILAIRYRYVTRVLHQDIGEGDAVKSMTRLEVHTVSQAYKNKRWQDKKLARRYSEELFSRVGEMLAKK